MDRPRSGVTLTGSVESTEDNLHVERSGANPKLADDSFMVIGPIRECADQIPTSLLGR